MSESQSTSAAPRVAPYGSWKSPIASDLIVSSTIGLGGGTCDGADIYWSELRPAEGGRNAIVRRTTDGRVADVTPPPFNARTRVHEYGGGAYGVFEGVVYFVNFADQRLYRQPADGKTPEPVTPEGPWRYADFQRDRARNRLIAVGEEHREGEGEPRNVLVAIALDGSGAVTVLAEGADFYASPALSPDGCRLAWLEWNHPNMPWDGTELRVADVRPDGSLGEPEIVAGGPSESIFQPQWSPSGRLYFASDRAGWWNLYRQSAEGAEALYPTSAEFGLPQWVFGQSVYGFIAADRLLCAYTQNGTWNLSVLDANSQQMAELALPYTAIGSICVADARALFLAGSPREATSLVLLDLSTREMETLQRSSSLDLDPGYLSEPEPVEFPTAGDKTAYGLFYPPKNKDYRAPEGEKPPLKVKIHGGPTAQTGSTLNLSIQYWTSRGFAVLDVNYGGSTGYGRDYRRRLDGNWGIADAEDCVNGAKYLTDRGWVDGDRLTIAGGSAGGYTTLAVLTFYDTFKAGASYYGVSDLEALARDTHKFESRYLDRLVGPYPERKDLYVARSPIHHVDRLSCPAIFFQGLEDKIVPPNQAELMVEALKKKGIPVAYVPFAGEQHGFRQAENIKRALDGEFYFYAQVFGFEPADDIEPLEIANL